MNSILKVIIETLISYIYAKYKKTMSDYSKKVNAVDAVLYNAKLMDILDTTMAKVDTTLSKYSDVALNVDSFVNYIFNAFNADINAILKIRVKTI